MDHDRGRRDCCSALWDRGNWGSNRGAIRVIIFCSMVESVNKCGWSRVLTSVVGANLRLRLKTSVSNPCRILPLKSINERIEADVLAALREDRSTKAIARSRSKRGTDSLTPETYPAAAAAAGKPSNGAAFKSNISSWRGDLSHDNRTATL